VLRQIFNLLKNKYKIIYYRPTGEKIMLDNQECFDLDDYEMIEKDFPEVITMPQLSDSNRDLTFNSLYFMVSANCNNFISVQGGGSILASYFGGVNIIYAKKGFELNHNSYKNWYNKFSGCKIFNTDNYGILIDIIKAQLMK
jgi:hypothetical protein